MKKWEYQLLVQFWDHEKGQFYWADNETDQRNSHERLDVLERQGWEIVLVFPCGVRVRQHNYLLKRLRENGKDVDELQSPLLET